MSVVEFASGSSGTELFKSILLWQGFEPKTCELTVKGANH